jgi:hypothetical protein
MDKRRSQSRKRKLKVNLRLKVIKKKKKSASPDHKAVIRFSTSTKCSLWHNFKACSSPEGFNVLLTAKDFVYKEFQQGFLFVFLCDSSFGFSWLSRIFSCENKNFYFFCYYVVFVIWYFLLNSLARALFLR